MSAYGLWSLVLINSAIFILFAFSFTRPRINSDWRSFGVFSAFIVSMFTEMYGFPLPIYLLSGWLGERFPLLDLFSHSSGHLWHTLFGMKGDPHLDPFHILSKLLIFGGFIFLAAAWEKLYRAQREHTRATTGAYACVRHPQYGAFIVIMFGFLLQWPTLLTLLMFPVLVWMYVRLPLGDNLRMAAFGSMQEGDPVCGMDFPASTGYSRMYQGQEYRFCSRDCLDKFDAGPAR